ncbi:MAG: membrane protein insertion efficiency factor YidD [Ferruginibacter sp.]
MTATKKILSGENSFEINADEKDLVIIERQLNKHTLRDIEIQSQAIPKNSLWLKIIVRLIRYYQKKISPRLGNRCVYDPSCSRYAEMAYRKKGFLKGSLLTIKRLYRCRAKNGGIDEVI